MSDARRVVLIGAGDQAREALDVFAEANRAGASWEVLGVVVEPGHHPADHAPAGAPILGRYVGHRAGHAVTNKLLRVLFSDPTAFEMVECDARMTARLPGAGLNRADGANLAA